ncbi:MAG TPA: septum formation initiator family protein [Verrucomicrobiales bacterium]|jgi:cell division protein FtsB|nr:septum formation initiator family protein [Verrucomicrobiales bacterium]
MNVTSGIWEKLTRIVQFLIALIAILGVFVWYLPLIKENEKIRTEVIKLEDEIEAERLNEKNLNREIEALNSNPETVETLAREVLGLAKQGETIIKFKESD